jgi:hypothetical protein
MMPVTGEKKHFEDAMSPHPQSFSRTESWFREIGRN